jgi:hypothetical protein
MLQFEKSVFLRRVVHSQSSESSTPTSTPNLKKHYIQGVIEMCDQILTTTYWLHVELGKNILKILGQKIT